MARRFRLRVLLPMGITTTGRCLEAVLFIVCKGHAIMLSAYAALRALAVTFEEIEVVASTGSRTA